MQKIKPIKLMMGSTVSSLILARTTFYVGQQLVFCHQAMKKSLMTY